MFGKKTRLYEELYKQSGVSSQIVDGNGFITLESEGPFTITDMQRLAASQGPITLDAGARLVRTDLKEGSIYEAVDRRREEQLEEAIEKAGSRIAAAAPMGEETEAAQQRASAYRHQSSRYDAISGEIDPQLQLIDRLLSGPESGFRRALPYAMLVGAYIKRYRRLRLLVDEGGREMSFNEFKLALTESLDFLQLCGTSVFIQWDGTEDLPGDLALFTYQFFEYALETVMTRLSGAMVRLVSRNGVFSLRLSLDGTDHEPDPGWRADRAAELGANISIEHEGQSLIAQLTWQRGGDEQ